MDFGNLVKGFEVRNYYNVKGLIGEEGVGADRQVLVYGDRGGTGWSGRDRGEAERNGGNYGNRGNRGDGGSGGGGLNWELIRSSLERGVRVVLVLPESGLGEGESMELLEDGNLVVVCHKLRHFQQLLSYKTEDNLFLDHRGVEVPKRVILLMRDKKRLEHVEQVLKPKMKEGGSGSIKIFRAIDAMTPNAIDNFVRDHHIPILQPIRAGKIGCAFSHLSLWREFVNSLHPSMMILEDDVVPTRDYGEIKNLIGGELPVTFDILYLYVSPKFYRNDEGVQLRGKKWINRGYYVEDLSAYLISRKGARKLLRKLKGLSEPLESMIQKEVQKGDLEVYTTKKVMFENIGQKTATQDNILESNTYDSQMYDPDRSEEGSKVGEESGARDEEEGGGFVTTLREDIQSENIQNLVWGNDNY